MAHSLLQIGFPSAGDTVIGCHAVTPEIEQAIREAGGEPAMFNRMVWPAGASRHARGFFLLHHEQTVRLHEEGGGESASPMPPDTPPPANWGTTVPPPTLPPALPLYTGGFQFGGVEFDRVSVRNPVPLLINEGSGVVYIIEVVDERFDWQDNCLGSDKVSFNLALDDKQKSYFSSLFFDEDEDEYRRWTTKEALETLIATLSSSPDEFNIYDEDGLLDSDNDPQDVIGNTRCASKIIDHLLALRGMVLLAYPNTDLGQGYRYWIAPNRLGEETASAQLLNFTNSIIGGGLYCPTSDFVTPPEGTAKRIAGPSDWQAVEVPGLVRVSFPAAVHVDEGETVEYVHNREDDTKDEPGIDYTAERRTTLTSTSGRPWDGNNQVKHLFDTTWALLDRETHEVVNSEALQSRADEIAEAYYSRFYAACGDVLFSGINPILPWPGALEIVWQMSPSAGPTTRASGHFDDPLFGFNAGAVPLTAEALQSTGLIRSFPRSDGGVLLDVPVPAGSRMYYGRITAVYGSFGADYDAEAISNPAVSVVEATPKRVHDPAFVDIIPAAVDDGCWLGVNQDGTIDLYVAEKPTYTACPPRGLETPSPPVISAHGL